MKRFCVCFFGQLNSVASFLTRLSCAPFYYAIFAELKTKLFTEVLKNRNKEIIPAANGMHAFTIKRFDAAAMTFCA